MGTEHQLREHRYHRVNGVQAQGTQVPQWEENTSSVNTVLTVGTEHQLREHSFHRGNRTPAQGTQFPLWEQSISSGNTASILGTEHKPEEHSSLPTVGTEHQLREHSFHSGNRTPTLEKQLPHWEQNTKPGNTDITLGTKHQLR